MSSESFAALRKHSGNDLAQLAEEHFKHDLTETDRQTLQTAASRVGTSAAVGSVIGITLGAFLAFRLRRARTKMFAAIRATERPTHVQFADGRTQEIPDMTPYMKPTTLGDVATYTFFSAGGLFLGGEIGGLGGGWSAKRLVTGDEESRKRIETAFRRFKADVLRRQVEELETGKRGIEEGAGSLLT